EANLRIILAPRRNPRGFDQIIVFKDAAEAAGETESAAAETQTPQAEPVLQEASAQTVAAQTQEAPPQSWAELIVHACAGAVHNGRVLAASAFAPYFVAQAGAGEGVRMAGAEGHPQGLLFANAAGGGCMGSFAAADAARLSAELEAAARAAGAIPTDAPARITAPKFLLRAPEGAAGADALVVLDAEYGPLLVQVRRAEPDAH
ncbi:MAG: hypothetical protein AB7L65_03375, partial [Hyphomonadaceae bacterium]